MKVHTTCGRGTETFAENEVIGRLQAHVLSVEDGKVFFETESRSTDFNKILDLKTVERVFATIAHFPTVEIKGNGKVRFLHDLKGRILNPTALKEAAKLVQRVHSSFDYEQHSSSHVFTKGVIAGSQNQHPSAPLFQKCSGMGHREHLKRKAEPFNSSGTSVSCEEYAEKSTSRHRKEMCSASGMQKEENDIVTQEEPLQKRWRLNQDQSGDNCSTRSSNCAETVPQLQSRTEDASLTFRVSVKCAGWCRKWLQPQRLAKECGVKLSLMLGWAVDLQSPQVEVCIHVNDDFVTAGIPFTQRPLSKRSYILDPGLRSTVSWIMAHVAEIQPTDRVLDPMCGKATVLLEAAMQNTKAAEFIGCDSNAEQLAVASKNITFAGLRSCVHLICADATNLPLSTASVEKIVCDAPFGQKFTTSTSLPSFYHKLLKELHRVLAPEGRLVLLTSQDLVPVVEHCIQRLHLEDAEHLSQQLIHDTVFDCSLSGRQEKLCGTHKTDDADDSSPHDTFQLTRSASSLRQLQNLAEESDDSVRCESVRLKENAVGSETQLPSVGQTGTDDLEGLVCTAVHTFKEEDDTKLSSVFSDGEVSEPTQKLVGKKKINAVDVPSSEFTLSQCDESSLHSKLSCSSSADPVADLKHLGCESLKTLCIKTKHYVKLGETHAYIMVMEKD